MSICICQRAKLSGRKEAIPDNVISNYVSYMVVNNTESYIETECDVCDCLIYTKLDYCPFCGCDFSTKKGGQEWK